MLGTRRNNAATIDEMREGRYDLGRKSCLGVL